MTGFILWYLTRELLYFKKTRQSYLRRPEISSQIAQRTILIAAIPKHLLTIAKLTEVFGPSIVQVWINRNYNRLQELVYQRNKYAIILEGAETKLILTANKIAVKKGRQDIPENYNGNISTLYVEERKRPRHKIRYPVISLLFGKKVQTHWGFLIVG